jgi:hypothetical protein
MNQYFIYIESINLKDIETITENNPSIILQKLIPPPPLVVVK